MVYSALEETVSKQIYEVLKFLETKVSIIVNANS